MKLTARLGGANGAPVADALRTVETGALSIGRGPDNEWVLADPERTLSKHHCRIDHSGSGYMLTDLSTNGTFVGGGAEPVGRGRSRQLSDGDVVALGPYRIAIAIETVDDHAPSLLAFTGTPLFGGGPAAEGGAPSGPQPIPSPFIGYEQVPHSPLPEQTEGSEWLSELPTGEFSHDLRAQPEGWSAAPNPEDLAASGARYHDDPLAANVPEFSTLDEHVAAPSTLLRLPTASRTLPLDWNEQDGEAGPAAVGAEPVPQSTGVSAITLIDAFLHGAGLAPGSMAGADPAAAFEDIGRLVRTAIDGVREILMTRALVKAEFRVEKTIVQSSDNSPLKFVPDLDRCVAAMVGEPPPGFTRGSTAMEQSLNDIKAHELALVAAVNTVVAELGSQLNPETIRNRADADSTLIDLVPAARRARYWMKFEETYAALKDGTDATDAEPLLAPFAHAYMKQMQRAS